MSVREDITNAITKEMILSYTAAGRVVPTTLSFVAASLADAVDFKDEAMVHAAFKKARDTEAIPLQGTLKGIVDGIRQQQAASRNALEYSDPRWPWLPKSDTMRKVNFDLAVKRLCIAQGEKEYKRYVDVMTTRKDGDKVVYVNPSAAKEFIAEKSAFIKELYLKYIRTLPEYKDYPQDARLNFGLLPPEVAQFKQMLDSEANDYAWGDYN